MSGPVVVALGGGHGLAATLTALRYLTEEITAIVTVADDGGSSGRLRSEFGVLPPGDLRMALAALCSETDWGQTWRDVLQHRFSSRGPLDGHALGNLLIVALWQLHEDPVAGLDLVGNLLQASGRVLPMAAVPLTIEADVSGLGPDAESLIVVRGQAAVAVTEGTVEQVRLLPPDPPAYPESVAAIRAADWVVLGPGSWFTSVMTHLMVPELREALEVTRAHKALVLNLEAGTGETAGFTAVRHLETLAAIAPALRFDAVLADPQLVGHDEKRLRAQARRLGAELHVIPVRRVGRDGEHDPLRYAAALRDVFGHPRSA